jgi:hypothetical protein
MAGVDSVVKLDPNRGVSTHFPQACWIICFRFNGDGLHLLGYALALANDSYSPMVENQKDTYSNQVR